MTTRNEAILAANIVALSVSARWEIARTEWDLNSVYFDDDGSTCLCSHAPIKEICVLRNRLNGNGAEVGNVCVSNFIGLPSELIFDGLKRVSKDQSKALNAEAARYVLQQGWISRDDFDFVISTCRKRVLSIPQMTRRRGINAAMVELLNRPR